MKYLTVFFLLLTFEGCSTQPHKAETPGADWSSAMRQMANALAGLYPIVLSEKQFNSPDNTEKIQNYTEILARNAISLKDLHLKENIDKIDRDPSLKYVISSFGREMATAVDGLKNGKRDYSRSVLRITTTNCIQCHTRGKWGPEFSSWPQNFDFPSLRGFERAEFLSAIRRYDEALEIYEGTLSDLPSEHPNPFLVENAVRNTLNILIRVKQDPNKTMGFLNQILALKTSAPSLRREAFEWRKAVIEWQSEKKDITENKKFEVAQLLIQKARKYQSFWEDQYNYIAYLRGVRPVARLFEAK